MSRANSGSPSSPRIARAISISLAWVLSGCVGGGEEITAPPLDAERYETELQPFVAASCATLDCHGDPGRPLRIYSELGLRLTDGLRQAPLGDAREPQPITSGELEANVHAFQGLLPELSSGDKALILSKPLAEAAGGGAHVGGDLFDGTDHPGYLCLERWLLGLADGAEACLDAIESIPNPPP